MRDLIVAAMLTMAFVVAGCTQRQYQWVGGTSFPQFQRDNYECTRDATFIYQGEYGSQPRLNWRLYEMCMKSRGYQKMVL